MKERIFASSLDSTTDKQTWALWVGQTDLSRAAFVHQSALSRCAFVICAFTVRVVVCLPIHFGVLSAAEVKAVRAVTLNRPAILTPRTNKGYHDVSIRKFTCHLYIFRFTRFWYNLNGDWQERNRRHLWSQRWNSHWSVRYLHCIDLCLPRELLRRCWCREQCCRERTGSRRHCTLLYLLSAGVAWQNRRSDNITSSSVPHTA